MPSNSLNMVVQHLCAAAGRDGTGRTDGELLTHFLSRRDEDALTALVERHAPMVWGVCRRVLRNPHDAEDAFQATFLVLVQKAAAVVPREMVANWLHGVAHQTAVRLRATAAKRGWREVQMTEMPEPAEVEARDEEMLSRLDEELGRLPARFRALIVLCDLEGRTRREVARQLGCPDGTVASGLVRARELLAKRLARRGLAVSGGSLAAALSHSAASADVPASVVTSATHVATLLAAGKAAGVISGPVATLTQMVLKAMLLKKIMTAVVVLALGVAVLAGGSLAVGQTEGKPTGGKDTKPVVPEKPVEPAPKQEKEAFTAWGQEAGGLQAGIVGPGSVRIGEKARFVVKLRNVSKETIKVSAWPLWRNYPGVVGARGDRVRTTVAPTPLFSIIPKALTLKPGETVDVGRSDLIVAEPDQKVTVPDGVVNLCAIHVKPGMHKAACIGFLKENHLLATGAVEFEVKAAKEGVTAWGKELGGLQAGLTVAEKRAYSYGESVTLVVRVRNASKEAVRFKYIKQYLDENPPGVTDADGKSIPQKGPSVGELRHAPVEVSLNAGQEIVLESRIHGAFGLRYELRPAGGGGTPATRDHPLKVGTGKVTLQYERVFGSSSAGRLDPDPALEKLATGKLELEVTDKPPEGEKEPKGAPVNPKPEAKKVYSPDELLREKYDSQATRTAEFKVVALAKPTEVKQSPAKDSPWVIGHGPGDVSLLPQPPKRFEEEQFSAILTSQVVGQLKRIGIKDVGKHFEGKTVRVSGRIRQHNYSGDDPWVAPHYDLVVEDVSQIEAVE